MFSNWRGSPLRGGWLRALGLRFLNLKTLQSLKSLKWRRGKKAFGEHHRHRKYLPRIERRFTWRTTSGFIARITYVLIGFAVWSPVCARTGAAARSTGGPQDNGYSNYIRRQRRSLFRNRQNTYPNTMAVAPENNEKPFRSFERAATTARDNNSIANNRYRLYYTERYANESLNAHNNNIYKYIIIIIIMFYFRLRYVPFSRTYGSRPYCLLRTKRKKKIKNKFVELCRTTEIKIIQRRV